jgi:hypothetical protein
MTATGATLRQWVSTRTLPALVVALLLQVIISLIWQIYNPNFFTIISHIREVPGPSISAAPSYGTPISEGAFDCERWMWYVSAPPPPVTPPPGEVPRVQCADGRSRTTFELPLFAFNVLVTAVPLAFVALRVGRWIPLLALPVFVAAFLSARALLGALPDLLFLWAGTLAVSVLVPLAWTRLARRARSGAAPA